MSVTGLRLRSARVFVASSAVLAIVALLCTSTDTKQSAIRQVELLVEDVLRALWFEVVIPLRGYKDVYDLCGHRMGDAEWYRTSEEAKARCLLEAQREFRVAAYAFTYGMLVLLVWRWLGAVFQYAKRALYLSNSPTLTPFIRALDSRITGPARPLPLQDGQSH
jgi:hypothetical protein